MGDVAVLTHAQRVAVRTSRLPVLVVGAGPAGLATARELDRRGIPYRLLERGPDAAYVWRNLYDSLTLHTGKHMSALPGLRFPRATPLFPSRTDFVSYLDRYRDRFRLHVETSTEVLHAVPGNGGWTLETSAGTMHGRALVMATGIVSSPRIPHFPNEAAFRGRIMHSVEYRRPAPFAGRRVLVVGCGNSGAEIASELGRAGVDVTIAVRSGANVVPLTILGVPVQYIAFSLRKLPPAARARVVEFLREATVKRRGPPVLPVPPWGPLERIPIIGFHLVDAIRDGVVRVKPRIRNFLPGGVRFVDDSEIEVDIVILATGFRPALRPLEGRVRVDESGFAARRDRVVSVDQPRLYFVGHNYDATGGLMNIARDAPLVAQRIAAET